ncbi:MAG: helix-turn-helix domain-containing protein [Tannerellaceae bacterium]|nr:helix-turn-helix domain-containing protein [Tannerellaceae bacterium]
MPGQIQEYEEVSKDFTAKYIMMSRDFLISLNLEEKYPMYNSASHRPCIALSGAEADALLDYFRIMQQMIRVKENPHRLQVARHLTIAFLWSLFHKMYVEREKSKHEQLFKNFIVLLERHFKEQHTNEFYADKLCLTPKYMSMVIKENSGRTATEWINNRIILEAKTLLYSTSMTIQQISDELSFSSQSSFGKYFKRAVGVSPKEFRGD